MSSLLALIKIVRDSRKREPWDLARIIELAEAEPEDTGVQTIAAYEAWLHGEHDVALRFARRAEEVGSIPFPALLVLTAVHAADSDEASTYVYAKRLASADRHDKTAHLVARALAGSRILSIRGRSAERQHIGAVAKVFDEWVAWSKEFVRSYESSSNDA